MEKQNSLCPSLSPAVADALVISSKLVSIAGLAHKQPSEIGSTSLLAVSEHMCIIKTFSATQHFGVCDSPAVMREGQRKPHVDPGINA